MKNDFSQPAQYVLFGIGVALGSAFGLVLGSLLTLWLGEGLIRVFQRGLRRITGNDDRPSLDLFMQ